MNALWRFKNNVVKVQKHIKNLPQEGTQEIDLNLFTSGKNHMIYKENFPTGRSWKAEELRLKSNSDLHKLWYVLLREKLALRADYYHYNQKKYEDDHIKNDMQKIKISMARLLTIYNERNLLHNEFLTFLEFYYIQKQKLKEKEMEEKIKEKDIFSEQPERQNDNSSEKPINISSEDKSAKIEMNNDNNIYQTKENLESIDSSPQPSNESKVTVLNENEIKLVKTLERPFRNKDLLYSYVKNSHLIKGKQRRKLISEIRAARSKQAKEIFTKELYAISQKLEYNRKEKAKQDNEEIRRRLENIV
jgi:hypothetical protein